MVSFVTPDPGLVSSAVNNLQQSGPTPTLVDSPAVGDGAFISPAVSGAQVGLNSGVQQAKLDEVLAIDDDAARADALGELLADQDADGQAQIIGEVLAQDPEAVGYDGWLNPSQLVELNEYGLVSNSSATAIADGIAAAWNRGLIPESDVVGGIEGSALDVFGINGVANDFANFFNNSRSAEVNEFRGSFAEHIYETYVSDAFPYHGDLIGDQVSGQAALVAARLVSDNGVPHHVTLDFYDSTFGRGQEAQFADFLGSATEAYHNGLGSFVPNYDPVIAFAEATRLPSGPHDQRYYDHSTTPSREQLAIGIAQAIGSAESDSGFFGTTFDGALSGSNGQRTARLEAVVEVLSDHGTAIFDQLAINSGITLNSDATIAESHPTLVNLLRQTVGNTNLDNREVARDAALDYFDRQIDIIASSEPGDPNTVAQDRATNIVNATVLGAQDIVADDAAVTQARRDAATFVLDTALDLIPLGDTVESISGAVTDIFGDSLPAEVAEQLVSELASNATGRLTSGTRDAVLDALIEQGGVGGSVASAQEFIDLTANRLQAILNIENAAGGDLGIVDGHVEQAFDDILDGIEG